MNVSGPARTVFLAAQDDFGLWRDAARGLIQAGIAPDHVIWRLPGEHVGDLFAGSSVSEAGDALPQVAVDAPSPRVSRAFLDHAARAVLHADPGRFDLLYRLLWRLQSAPRLMEDRADPDVRRIDGLARAVGRDIHKMRAFVRFREVADAQGSNHYVAWFEPAHHILKANAAFFVRRFTTMRWSILTPLGALHWDGETLREGPPAQRADAPGADPAEDLWRTYYAAIFNPARLKVGAMVKEMPRRYWKNLPEAALIPELVATAQAREAAMVALGGNDAPPAPETLADLEAAVGACRRCAIGCNGTRAVAGEGPDRARVMIVGEQPGDCEERDGRPFIGPAGQVLRSCADAAGLDLASVRLTNAVRHFRFVARGKVRLHQNPSAREIDTCRWWLDAERRIVAPRLVLALGASAARAVLGRTVAVQKERGVFLPLDDGADLLITAHPSYLLRLGDKARAEEERRFTADLAMLARRIAG
ncbi:uracil-DNA glycosylase superfamily protein [Novosphingobium nitrogenifigens DSM 19370]|uniref:Type-4 uracil-DNA glycosylase n=1 Tax=Novosphingobium nitrogenifigens DSM 19370 TaxID=983920 RepID=F1Z9J2_9SPHN|nr:UdgX family uracil-DNA binding protein [Novosphingobium nitrogenifigens]EGD58750.1 uracil-DNA glycosylase superfamily protein [Novosphingobium nitrogenifigens DSM 19370]